MKFIDTHVHLGDYEKIKFIVENSKYKEEYRLYSAINPEVLKHRNEYLRQCEKFFAMPMVLMELNIKEENKYILDFCKNSCKAIPVLLVGDNTRMYHQNKICFLKEHFIYHIAGEWKERKQSYEYLDSIGGFLIIHSMDSERINYIRFLRDTFRNIRIIIAHMGRNVWEDYKFTISIIDTFINDDNIFFDVSTITKVEIIQYALRQVGSKRILFASDFPYEFNIQTGIKNSKQRIESVCLNNEESKNIFYKNAERMIKYAYK